MSETVAIFALDPGTASGIATGKFSLEAESVWEGIEAGKWESWEVGGAPSRQAWEIMEEYAERTNWPDTDASVRWHLVFEDFVIRLGPGASSKRNLLDPVRVVEGCETLSWLRNGMRWAFPVYQAPSQAKNFATDARLREHDMWVKGSDHRRDAVRHMITRYATVIGELKEGR